MTFGGGVLYVNWYNRHIQKPTQARTLAWVPIARALCESAAPRAAHQT